MNYGHWEFDIEFNPEDWFGFIYRITELDTNKMYVGKKNFTRVNRKKVKGRKNRKKVVSVSDWETYTGSSAHLNEQIISKGKNNYKFEIISLHKSKGSLYYAEVERQIKEDVLRRCLPNGEKMFYNRFIGSVKFIPPIPTDIEIKHFKPFI